jgi:hypothetical protein
MVPRSKKFLCTITYVIARETQRNFLGGGAIADRITDAKNASVDGPLPDKADKEKKRDNILSSLVTLTCFLSAINHRKESAANFTRSWISETRVSGFQRMKHLYIYKWSKMKPEPDDDAKSDSISRVRRR